METVVAIDGAAIQSIETLDRDKYVMPLIPGAPFGWWEMGEHVALHGMEGWKAGALDGLARSRATGNHPYFSDSLDGHAESARRMQDRIFEAICSLSDERSRLSLKALVDVDTTWMLDDYTERLFTGVQYFEGLNFDIVKPRVLNLGIHTGWELPAMAMIVGERGGTIANVDPMGGGSLEPYVATFLNAIGAGRVLSLHNQAMDSYTGTCRLPVTHDGQAIGAANGELMTQHPTKVFPCCSMDDFTKTHGDFNIVKMDTEGAEPNVLWGGLNSLRRMRPQMAISIYHNDWHCWEIPLWVKRHLPNYKLFIRLYSYTSVESICYAIPEEIVVAEGLR